MTPPDLTRRLAARKLTAARLATDLILDCERAASDGTETASIPRVDGERLALLFACRPIARDVAARAALSHDRRDRDPLRGR